MIGELAVSITHSQIFVNVPSTPSAGLIWTDEDTAQGFAWAPGIACFGVPDHDGQSLIRIDMAARADLDPEALWALRVPFHVESGKIIVGSTFEETEFTLENAQYSLLFEALSARTVDGKDYAFLLVLKFIHAGHADFEILKQGDYLKTDHVLKRRAQYA